MVPPDTDTSTTSTTPRSSRRTRTPHASPSIHTIGLPPALPAPPLPALPSTYEYEMAPSLGQKRAHTPLSPTPRSPNAPRSGEVSDDDFDHDMLAPRARVRGSVTPTPTSPTPRRKIVNAMDAPVPRAAKRPALADRLSAAATPSRRMSAIPVPIVTRSAASPIPSPVVASASDKNDKVIVCMRIKPTQSQFATTAYELTPTSLALSETHPSVVRRGGRDTSRESEYTFQFDTLVQFPARTPDLYAAKVAPLVGKAMKGFNSTVFAYGQTGSGKSHTMSGTPSELGIIPCAIDGIFDAITADMDRAFLLRVSYIEIYNETLRDLLNFKKGPLSDSEKLTIRTAKGKIHVEPLVEEIVSCPEDVVQILEKGNNNRRTGATDWNERSSRSHAVFTIVIESRPRDATDTTNEVRVSRLTLIDLAGSEKAVSDADRRAEGKHINRSLLALREVVHKLTEKGKRGHIPYRDSKLTHLLENVLGGDSNICVICTMSAQEEHQTETLETLKFAGRCSQVVTKAQKNILQSSEQALIRAKDMEISELRRQLEEVGASAAAEARAQEGHAELVGELEKMEKRKAQLRNELAHLNSQILTSENPAAGSGIGVGAAPSTPRKRRARISDVSAHSSAAHFLGLGGLAGTPRKTDRRAVSSVQRSMMVEEDSDMDSDGPTATERDLGQLASASVSGGYAVAMTLRATVTEREGQIAEQAELLAAVKAEAAELPVLKAELHGTKSALSSARDEHAAQLRDLEAELESTRVAHAQSVADERASIEGLEAQVLALREEREEARTATGEHGKRVQGLEARVAAAESERDARAAELAALREAHAAALAALEKERDAAQAAQAVVSAKRADVEAKLVASGEERAVEAASLKAEKEKATAALETFQRAALEREADVVATLRADLVKERTRREAGVAEIEAMVKRATEEGDAHAKEKGELAAQLAAIRAEHEAATANFQTASAARDAAEAAAKSASEAATKRETGLTSELAAAVEERDALRTQHATAAAAAEQVSAQLAEREAAHAAAVKDVEALRAGADVAASVRAELDTHRGLLAAERDKAAAAAATHAETCARADALADKLGAAERAAKAHAEEKDASASEARTSAARVAELVAALEDAHKGHAAAATRAAADLRSADDARRDEARAIRSELEGVKARLVSVTCTLEEERAARTATAAGAEDVAKAMAELRAELAAAKNETAQRAEREAALVAKNEALEKAAKVAADAEAARIKAEAEIKTKAKGHAVSASVPNALPGPPASACPAHVAEIERLDKVVNAQKAIIEEQRAKIAHWAGELERQREVVRLLSEGVSPHSGPIPLPSVSAVSTPSSPRKSASVVSGTSAASDTLTPTASPRANGSKHARYLGGSTPSSYLAPPSPLPMPTHSGQQSNVLRKARRITIEHDMGRLADAGRVNQVKGVFDSPDKSKLNDKEKEVKRAPVVPGAAPAAARDVFRRA